MTFGLPDFRFTRWPEMDLGGPAGALAAGFGATIGRLHLNLQGDPDSAQDVAALAALASAAVSEGHTCITLARLAQDWGRQGDVLRVLEHSPAVSVERAGQRATTPLVLSRGRLYLQRYFEYERQLAEDIRRLDRVLAVDGSWKIAPALAQFFDGGARESRQQLAAALALTRQLTLVTGGPGTGKTRTVARLLMALVRITPDVRIALCAPTGKAARRLQESIDSQLQQMNCADEYPQLTQLRATTVHRLLGVTHRASQYRHGRERPLAEDVIVLDEASMLDLSLASHFFAAIAPGTRVIVLGDAEQLASVESGAVFAELVSLKCEPPPALADIVQAGDPQQMSLSIGTPLAAAVVELTESFRYAADGGLAQLARAVREGDAASVEQLLASSTQVVHEDPGEGAARLAAAARLALQPFVDALVQRRSATELLSALDRQRILCATRKGPKGAERINELLSTMVRAAVQAGMADAWYAGRVVMVTQNDPLLKVFNGDIGIALPGEDGVLMVHFSTADGNRTIAPMRLPQTDTAFALTVHKAQGSEFDQVEVVLPELGSPLNTREMLYTALTRARTSARLWGEPVALFEAVARPTERDGALALRLRQP